MGNRIRMRSLAVFLFACACLPGQTNPAPAQPAPAPDAVLNAAQNWIGRALVLRGFYGGGELEFDASGRVQGQPKTVDWTLAEMSLEKVTRRSAGSLPGELLLEGRRVAVRYNAEQHVFERHPMKEEKLRVVVPAPADARGVDAAMAKIFSVGIDPALQRSMPAYWSHYFIPATEWPADALSGQAARAIAGVNGRFPPDAVMPVAEKKAQLEITSQARVDRVKGSVQMTLVVDADGLPRRVAIRQPLGYGLDAKMAEALGKLHFQAGTVAGRPVAMEMVIRQEFDATGEP